MLRIIALQYNPETLSRTLQVQGTGEGGGQRSEALRLKGPAGRDDQARGRDRRHRPARVSGAEPAGRRIRHLPAARRAGDDHLSDERAAAAQRRAGRRRHAGDRADGGAADAVHLEQEPHRAGPDHRIQRHRGGVRRCPQPDPRQGEPRHAGAQRRRPRLRARGGGLYMGYQQPKEQLAQRAQAGTFAALGIGGLP